MASPLSGRCGRTRKTRPYNPEYPDYFLRRVREEGIFDNLGESRPETKIDDKTHIVDVTLNFKYAPTPVNRKKLQPF